MKGKEVNQTTERKKIRSYLLWASLSMIDLACKGMSTEAAYYVLSIGSFHIVSFPFLIPCRLLQRNSLTGSIPSSLGSLTGLFKL